MLGRLFQSAVVCAVVVAAGVGIEAAPTSPSTLTPDGVDAWPVEPELTIKAHPQSISDVEILPDGKQAISIGGDLVARLWSLDTGGMLREFSVAPAQVACVAVSHDGKRLAIGGADKAVRVFEIESGEVIALLEPHARGVTSLAFRPNGELVTGGSGGYYIWNVDEEKIVHQKPDSVFDTLAFAVSASGRTAAYMTRTPQGRRLHVVDLDKRQLLRDFPATGSAIRAASLLVSPDGRFVFGYVLAANRLNRTPIGWDVEAGQATVPMPEFLEAHRFAVDGRSTRMVVSRARLDYSQSYESYLMERDEANGYWRPVALLGRGNTRATAISADGTVCVVGSGPGMGGREQPGMLTVFRERSMLPVRSPILPGVPIGSVSWDAVPVTYRQRSGLALPLHRVGRRGHSAANGTEQPRVRRLAANLDVVWWRDAVALMSEPGQLREVLYAEGEGYSDVVFDGTHIWVSSTVSGIKLLNPDGSPVELLNGGSVLEPANDNILLYPLAPGRVLACGGSYRISTDATTPAGRQPIPPGWCGVLSRAADDGPMAFRLIMTEADLPVAWPKARNAPTYSGLAPRWITGESADGKLKAVWIGGSKLNTTPLLRVDAGQLTWSAHNLGSAYPAVPLIEDAPLIYPTGWFTDGNRKIRQLKPDVATSEPWDDAADAFAFRPGVSGLVTLLESDRGVVVAGQEWTRFDAATRRMTNLGPGLRIDAGPVWSNITYYNSSHHPIAAISQRSGMYYRFSVDPQKPLANRPRAEAVNPAPVVDQIITVGTITQYFSGPGSLTFSGPRFAPRDIGALPGNPMRARIRIATQLSNVAKHVASGDTVPLIAAERLALQAVLPVSSAALPTQVDISRLEAAHAACEKATPSEALKAAQPLFAAAAEAGRRYERSLIQYVSSMRAAVSPATWKRVCDEAPGLHEEIETFFPRN